MPHASLSFPPPSLEPAPRRLSSDDDLRPRPTLAAALDEDLAGELNDAVVGRRGLELSLAVGRVVVERLYGGDPAAWRVRGPKALSLRRLVAEAELPMTAAALCRALGVYEVWTTAASGRPWSNLTAAHYRAVLDVRPEGRESLLESAWRERWSAEELRRRARDGSERRRPRGGRLPSHPIARAVERMEREYAQMSRRDVDTIVVGLSGEAAHALAGRCDRIAERLILLAGRLRRR